MKTTSATPVAVPPVNVGNWGGIGLPGTGGGSAGPGSGGVLKNDYVRNRYMKV